MDEEEEKQQIQRLNFNAPLLSVRRIPSRLRPATTGPLHNPGLVPFTWEQTPGRPKPPPAPTSSGPIQETGEEEEEEEEEEDVFSDALSLTDDSSEPSPDISRRSGSFRKDPQLGELMMGRFLSAAKAVATGPLQTNASRKDGRDGDYGHGRERKRFPLPFQHQPEFLPKNGSGRGGGGCDDVGGRHFSMACGLIPRFFLLNPVGCLESRGRALDQDEVEHSWDAVYTHKLGREDGGRLTGESNRLAYWSDSQSPNGSSPYYGKDQNSGSFGSYEKSGESNLDPTPSRSNGKGSMSSAADRFLDSDYVQLVDTPNSKTSSADETAEADNVVVADGCRLQPECCTAELGLLSCSAKEHCEEIDGSGLGEDGGNGSKEKSDTSLALSLLPLPLPSSPSESWLHRTLPSVSSKNPPPRSWLGIQIQHQRRPSRSSLKDSSKW